MNTSIHRANTVNRASQSTTNRSIPAPRRQRGLTLIELMISVTIGLVFIFGAVTFLVSGHQSFRAQNSGSRIQENARFALDILQEHVRMAGYNDTTSSLLDLPALIYRGACGTINDLTANPCSDDTTADQGDRLAMALRIPTGATGVAAQDCMGLPLTNPNQHVVNVFWVEQDDSSGVSSLYCRGYNPDINDWNQREGEAQPLVDGIEQMQVQYGLVDGNTSSTGNTPSSGTGGRVDRYLNATQLQTLDDDPANANRNYWGDVRSVRIALLVSAGAEQAADDGANTLSSDTLAANQTFTLLDGAAYTPAETRIRRVFSTTITLNNALADTRRKP